MVSNMVSEKFFIMVQNYENVIVLVTLYCRSKKQNTYKIYTTYKHVYFYQTKDSYKSQCSLIANLIQDFRSILSLFYAEDKTANYLPILRRFGRSCLAFSL